MKLIKNTVWILGLGALLSIACGKSKEDGGDGDGSGGDASASGGNASGGSGGGNGSGGNFSASGGRDNSSDGGENGLGGDGSDGGSNGDLTACDEVDEPCCGEGFGNTECGGGLECQGFGPNASCQAPPDTSECDTVGDECCEGNGFGPGICAEGLSCEQTGQGQDATFICEEDEDEDEDVDTTECDEVGEECCSTGQGPGSNVCGNGLECNWGGQGVGLICEEED